MTYAEGNIDTYSDEIHMPTHGRAYRDEGGDWCFVCDEGVAAKYRTDGHPTCLHAIMDGSARACCTALALMHPELIAVGHEIQGRGNWHPMLSRDAADTRNCVKRHEWFRHGRRIWMWLRAQKIVDAGY